jgi:hypothetical protein
MTVLSDYIPKMLLRSQEPTCGSVRSKSTYAPSENVSKIRTPSHLLFGYHIPRSINRNQTQFHAQARKKNIQQQTDDLNTNISLQRYMLPTQSRTLTSVNTNSHTAFVFDLTYYVCDISKAGANDIPRTRLS